MKQQNTFEKKQKGNMKCSLDDIYMCDFETRAGEKAIEEKKTWVWAWGMVPINNPNEFHHGATIGSFMSWLLSLRKKSTLYFHNLKFDGSFIIDWLLKNGWIYAKNSKDVKAGEFSVLMSEMGIVYSITLGLKSGTRTRVEIRDSFKKLPFSVKKIGKDFKTKKQKTSIDYVLDRPEGYIMEGHELEYLHNDVAIVAEVLATLYEDGMTAMTIGSDCLAKYKEMFGKEKFKEHFPQLSTLEDYYGRRSYKGGWCFGRPEYLGLLQHNGGTWDVNSLYPSMMHSNEYMLADGKKCINLYPVGEGEYFTGEPKKTMQRPLYIVRFDAMFNVKHNHLPTVQIKNSSRFQPNEYITETDEIVELYMTNVDFELFLKHYDCSYLDIKDGYSYMGRAGMFDEYVDKFMKDKIEGEGAVKQEAKLFLNNLYGKFAQKIESSNKHPYLNGNKVSYECEVGEDRKPVYIPVGTFVTAYARRFTITAAQENFHIFRYADTDSIHCTGQPIGIIEHDYKLCCWKHECAWDEALFVRQKTYAERVEGKWDIKCAGMNMDSKEVLMKRLEREPITIFKKGLRIEGKKLRQATVEGGIILIPTDFQIRA